MAVSVSSIVCELRNAITQLVDDIDSLHVGVSHSSLSTVWSELLPKSKLLAVQTFNCLLKLNVVNKQTGVNDKGEVTNDSKTQSQTKNFKIKSRQTVRRL